MYISFFIIFLDQNKKKIGWIIFKILAPQKHQFIMEETIGSHERCWGIAMVNRLIVYFFGIHNGLPTGTRVFPAMVFNTIAAAA